MSARTCYVALPFARDARGSLTPGPQRECVGAREALNAAHQLAESHAGALAFSRVIDIDAGRALPGRILAKVGDVPNVRYLVG